MRMFSETQVWNILEVCKSELYPEKEDCTEGSIQLRRSVDICKKDGIISPKLDQKVLPPYIECKFSHVLKVHIQDSANSVPSLLEI